MKNYKLYIIGFILLITGLVIGWMIKPTPPAVTNSEHNHEQEEINPQAGKEEIWTCSMHPQIRQNEPGICPICEMDLIILDNSMSNDDPAVLKMSNAAAKLAQVETFTVGEKLNTQSKNQSIKADGTVEMDERTLKSQTVHLAGRLETMSITFEGQYVTKGQKIGRLYSTELLAASQELITAAKYNDKVQGLKDASIQKLKNWKINDELIEKILKTEKPIETINIYADHSGYVLSKKLSQGDYVKQGQSLFTVGSTSRVWLIFNVFESGMKNIANGNEITFTTPSISNKEFKAKISFIDPLLNKQSRTATVRAEINNKGNLLKPGMLLNGVIQSSNQKQNKKTPNYFSVPNSAILWTGDKSVVYVQLTDYDVPSFEFREVTILDRSTKYTTIGEGLNNGDQVVVHGAFAIDAAAQLNNNMSMMNRNVKIKKDEVSDLVPSYVDETPQKFKSQLETTLAEYIKLKDALVDTDQGAASSSANGFLNALDKMDMSLLKGDAHMFWMEQLNILKSHDDKIKNSGDIEDQRNQFDYLSQAMIKSVKAFGTNNKTYFVQYCPMVNNNQGADWISTENEIRNPYFGDKMMKCGSVKLELK